MERYESETRSLHCEEEERRNFYAFFRLEATTLHALTKTMTTAANMQAYRRSMKLPRRGSTCRSRYCSHRTHFEDWIDLSMMKFYK